MLGNYDWDPEGGPWPALAGPAGPWRHDRGPVQGRRVRPQGMLVEGAAWRSVAQRACL